MQRLRERNGVAGSMGVRPRHNIVHMLESCLAAMRDLRLAHEKVNVNGGACALGHPIGASGARVVVTLIHALKERGLKRGVASLCIGGGEATAMAIELV